MRSAKALSATILFMLMIWPGVSMIARAGDDDTQGDADEYDVTARVVRTSLLQGEVSLRRAGQKQWERATLNLPLVEGDTLATGSDARMEIQIDARNFVRVGTDSVLRIVTLRPEGIALSLVQGTATLRLARFDRDKEYFEIDAPKTTLAAEKPGLYRLDVTTSGGVRLTVRDGGRARIYSETAGFTLRDERSAELVDSGADESDWQFMAASSLDPWDTWVDERERYLASRLRYEQRDRYYDPDIWGAEELDAYGDWVYANEYGGWVWRPHTNAINNYNNWAPYRYGHWRWCPPYGWVWVGDEPWGWAPYHYGRWVQYNNSWCWAPRGYGYRQRNWWRPALVVFVYVPTSYGEHVAWYPLRHGQHDPYRRNGPRRDGRLTPLRSDERDNLRRINPAYVRAVTSVPAREFGSDAARIQPATTDIAQRAVTGEPVRARLPIAPTDVDRSGSGERERQTRRLPARPATGVPATDLPERPTGAAHRQPGAPLDDELRRTRLYNGRAPRPSSPGTNTGTDPADRSTGAVARPTRPSEPSSLDQDTDTNRDFRNDRPSRARPERPAGPPQPALPEQRPPVSTDENVSPSQEREPRPARVPRPEAPAQPDETVSPPQDIPERRERTPARPERTAPVEREEPTTQPVRRPEREETPPSQPEPPRVEPSSPEPRPEPPAPRREEPAPPREEHSAPREEPARREETPAPPPPSPPPSSPPPPREDPPPSPEPPREAPPSRAPEEDRVRPPRD